MSDIIIPPTPNWFLNNCLCVSSDGYVIYGTLSIGIAILIPSEIQYKFKNAKLIRPAHKERITCLSLCPNWLNSRNFVSGSDDGYVKHWNAETFLSTIGHNTHSLNKENVTGVAFLDTKRVFSVGHLGIISIWNVNSNCVQSDKKILKTYKATCVNVCPHKPNVVAVGTKQGVVIVLSLDDTISILYKGPGHDSEITSLSWCPNVTCEYFDKLSKVTIKVNKVKKHKTKPCVTINETPEIIEQDQCSNDTVLQKSPATNEIIKINENTLDLDENLLLSKLSDMNVNETPIDTTLPNDEDSYDFLKECQDLKRIIESSKYGDSLNSSSDIVGNLSTDGNDDSYLNSLNNSSLSKFSPKPNETVNDYEDDDNGDRKLEAADESDIFDIYKDDNTEEFGHTRYVSKESHKEPVPTNDEASSVTEKLETISKLDDLEIDLSSINLNDLTKKDTSNTEVVNTYYLASCCKKGNVCVWKWGGMMVLSQAMFTSSKSTAKKNVNHMFGAIHWITTKVLLATSKDSKLLSCSFEDKLKISQIHNVHKRGLFCITSQNNCSKSDDLPSIAWTASMDRLLTAHSFENSSTTTYSTFGGFVYDIQVSPIDPKIIAIGSGDGMVRILRLQESNNVFEVPSLIKQLWHGIHGKVIGLSWHPNKETRLAFATYEGRIGLLNIITGAPAKILPFVMSLGVYNICWGLPDSLFACGNTNLVVYDVGQLKTGIPEPHKIKVIVCGQQWDISTVTWSEKFLSVGSKHGGFALLNPYHPYYLITATFPHKKTVSCISWHPTAVADDEGVSPYSDLVAVCANKSNIMILKLITVEDDFVLELYREIAVQTDVILNICWSPYHNGRLLTTSHDCTVNIWDIGENVLLHTFTGHEDPVYCATWCSPSHIISGSGDCTLRIWDSNKHPALEIPKGKEKQKKKIALAKFQELEENTNLNLTENASRVNDANPIQTNSDADLKLNLAKINVSAKKSIKKTFPLSIFWRQYKKATVEGCRRLFNKIVAEQSGDNTYEISYDNGYDYLRIYETHVESIELLKLELQNHQETYNWDAYAIVGVLEGNLRDVLEYIAKNGKLTPALLAMAPSISHRFWKEMLSNYCDQLEYSDAKKPDDLSGLDNCSNVWYGLLLLISGQIEEACTALANNGLEPEAICASRARHADHIAEQQMHAWIKRHLQAGQFIRAAECYLSLGLIMEAATMLGKLNGESELALAAEMAKYAGNTILADSLVDN